MSEQLKPCPGCAGGNIISGRAFQPDDYWYVCDDCGWSAGVAISPDGAAALWNTRTTTDAGERAHAAYVRGLEDAARIAADFSMESEVCVHADNPHWEAEVEIADAITDAIRDLAYGKAERPEAWQPIETAPRDGSEVILGVAGSGTEGNAGFYHDGSQCYGPRGQAGWFAECDRGNLLTASNIPATHWMPLPAAPAIYAERASGGAAE